MFSSSDAKKTLETQSRSLEGYLRSLRGEYGRPTATTDKGTEGTIRTIEKILTDKVFVAVRSLTSMLNPDPKGVEPIRAILRQLSGVLEHIPPSTTAVHTALACVNNITYPPLFKPLVITCPNLLKNMCALMWKSGEAVRLVLGAFMNLSYDEDEAVAVCEAGGLDIVVACLRTTDSQQLLVKTTTIAMRMSFHDQCLPYLTRTGAADAVMPYTVPASAHDTVIWQASVLVSNMLSRSAEATGHALDAQILKRIVQLLRQKLESPGAAINGLWYSLPQLTAAMSNLCIPLSNKPVLLQQNLVPLLVELMRYDGARYCDSPAPLTDVYKHAATAMWQLVFTEQGARAAERDGGKEALQKLVESCPEAKAQAQGALFQLDVTLSGEKPKGPAHTLALSDVQGTDSGRTKHVFLSYNHGSQGIVLRIKDALAARGFRCWVDVENMSGDMMRGMAEAVENASVMIVGLSQGYYESSACHSEAGYAFQRRVPFVPIRLQKDFKATGWLGLLVGMHLFIDFSDESRFEQHVMALCREIEKAQQTSTTQGEHVVAAVEVPVPVVEEQAQLSNMPTVCELAITQQTILRRLDALTADVQHIRTQQAP
eukprot:m.106403 g.106403  ORF g.106403 m.106403 type:complete len:599 (-) comp15774_c0_seq1:50-1846(-)